MTGDPTRILLAGDVHGNTGHMRYLIQTAVDQDCQVVVQLGDFGFWEHEMSGIRFLDDVAAAARAAGVTVYAIDGNHDKTSLVLDMYVMDRDKDGFVMVRHDQIGDSSVLYVPRGHRWTWSVVRFAAFGGAYSVDKAWRLQLEGERQLRDDMKEEARRSFGSRPRRIPNHSGTLWFPEEEMTDADMDRSLEDATPVDVMLTHDKPHASNPMWNRKDFPECLPNQRRLQRAVRTLQPGLLVHGHLHYRYRDTIRTGDDAYCRVEGLGGDPTADEHGGYELTDSWMVLDLGEVQAARAR